MIYCSNNSFFSLYRSLTLISGLNWNHKLNFLLSLSGSLKSSPTWINPTCPVLSAASWVFGCSRPDNKLPIASHISADTRCLFESINLWATSHRLWHIYLFPDRFCSFPLCLLSIPLTPASASHSVLEKKKKSSELHMTAQQLQSLHIVRGRPGFTAYRMKKVVWIHF